MPSNIFELLLGQTLTSAQFLLFDAADDVGAPTREAVELEIGRLTLLVRALTDTSELALSVESLVQPFEAEYQIVDACGHEQIAPFVGKELRNCWKLTNDRGYCDGLMLAFSAHQGLLLIAMNNEVSLLTVTGEQCS